MGRTRVFFPQQRLDQWIERRWIDVFGNEAILRPEGRRYRLLEAVRVLGEVSGTPDPFEVSGKVKSVAFLHELGAELLGESMVIGDNAFDVVPGWLVSPLGSFEAYRAKLRFSSDSDPRSDEELLDRFLSRAP